MMSKWTLRNLEVELLFFLYIHMYYWYHENVQELRFHGPSPLFHGAFPAPSTK